MVPPKGAARSQQPVSGKKPVRPVKPAIPLPHVKRQAVAAAKAAASTKSTSSPESEPKQHGEVVEPSKPNESSPAASTVTVDTKVDSTNAQPAISASPSVPTPNGHDASRDENISSPSKDPLASQAAPGNEIRIDNGLRGGEQDNKTPPNGTASMEGPEPKSTSADKPDSSRSAPAVPPNRRPIPPPFQPSNRPVDLAGNGGATGAAQPPVVNGRSQIHKSRPSHSNVHFGAFHDSTSSSPAPPLSGGIPAPSGVPVPDGRQPYMSHANSGFPPGMPPGLDVMAANNFDAYGRPNVGFPPMDLYQQYGNNYPPSTPHSFQDSQSSGHPEDGAPYHQFAAAGPRNGPPGYGDDTASHNPPARVPGNMPYSGMGAQGPPPSMMPQDDDAGGLIDHFQQQFGLNNFADCSLDLRHHDHRVTPIKIPGHRVVFSRSPVLSELLHKNVQQPTPQTLVLETEDEWIRADSFYMACQRLYGLPLLHPPPPRHSVDGDSMTTAGSTVDRFNFALSYAAAGHLIGWGPVVRRGCQIATQFLSLETVETAMQFSLSQYKDTGSSETFKYGTGSRIILDAVLDFVVNRMPSTFQLDTSVTNSEGYARLPYDMPSPTKPAEADSASPVIVRGNPRGHFSKESRGQSHPHIQFGDLSLTNGQAEEPSVTPKASQSAPSAIQGILSRVLINLPFGYLKMLVESGPGNLFRVVQETVLEREARRSRALRVLNTGGVPDGEAVRAVLRNLEPPQSNPWGVLGWREEIAFSSNSDGPSLGRQWVPLKEESRNSVAAFP